MNASKEVRIFAVANGFVVQTVTEEGETTKVFDFFNASEMVEELCSTLRIYDQIYLNNPQPEGDSTGTGRTELNADLI